MKYSLWERIFDDPTVWIALFCFLLGTGGPWWYMAICFGIVCNEGYKYIKREYLV